MSAQGATLQGLNNEMVICIEDLRRKRDAVNDQILVEQEEKLKIQNDLHILTERLARVNESISQKTVARDTYDRTVAETEGAYMKILESSQMLLNVLKKESANKA